MWEWTRSGFVGGVALGVAGCLAVAPEPRGETLAKYTGATQVIFTNASPDRMCGLYMSYDNEDDYGDNWLPPAGVASGASVEFRVRPGKYKARWDTCKMGGKARPYYAATLWREMGVVVDQQTQLFAYVADSVAPTKRAATLGRDYRVVRFPGQAIDRDPRPQPPLQSQQVALRASNEPPQLVGFIGRFPIGASMLADRPLVIEKFDAREFIEPRAAAKQKPPPKARTRPSLNRKHDLADRTIEYRKR